MRRDISLICPSNDGESVAIIDIARSLSIDVRVSSQPWGATLDKEPTKTFENLKQNVIIVEIPGLAKEAELRENHSVFIIDHHHYEGIDRRNPKSSLEQFADLIGYILSRREMGIALNDRGYIPALQRHGYTDAEIKEIRKFDLTAQGYTEDDFLASEREYSKGWIHNDALYVVETTRQHTSYLGDIHFWKKSGQGIKLDLLILKTASDNMVQDVSFSGSPSRARTLFAALGGFCGGDERISLYWGKDLNGTVSVESILGQVSDVLFRQASDIYEKG